MQQNTLHKKFYALFGRIEKHDSSLLEYVGSKECRLRKSVFVQEKRKTHDSPREIINDLEEGAKQAL